MEAVQKWRGPKNGSGPGMKVVQEWDDPGMGAIQE